MNDKPHIKLEYVLPRIRHEVRMMAEMQVDKLKEEIGAAVESAVLKRSSDIDNLVEQQVSQVLYDLLRERLRDKVSQVLNEPATHDRIDALVRKLVVEQLEENP